MNRCPKCGRAEHKRSCDEAGATLALCHAVLMPVQDIEQWKHELLEAGWTPIRSTIWESPQRLLYRGPYLAWCIMKGIPFELPSQAKIEGK